ncbi:methylesterase 18 [Selaginella moellendorffii]|uniref:methylesterase 18 n=1 Tax=Selaginella moellendorffii TaxID=88036 RepID=UPI000D1CB9B0|nr:methylesterase 18 [Selaginella moellendorffii]|eukprot:XP_024535035.1 methylesterase 18 [Selaginella moellendorffii]
MVRFVLVHGGGGGAWYWFKLVDMLLSSGHEVEALNLAASGIDTRTPADVFSLDDYNQPLLEYLAALPENDKVILVSHSLGGRSAAYATELHPDKIALAVYLAAPLCSNHLGPEFWYEQIKDTSVYDLFYERGKNNLPTAVMEKKSLAPDNTHQLCSSEDRTLSRMLDRAIPTAALFGSFTNTEEKYGSVPVVYIKTLQDLACPPEMQDKWIATHPFGNLKEVLTIDSDHCAALSAPSRLHDLLIQVVEAHAS